MFDAGGGGVDRRCRRGGGECVDDRLDADEEPERRFRWLSRLRTGFTSTGSCLIFWNEILVQLFENCKTSFDGLKRPFKLSLPILCKLNMLWPKLHSWAPVFAPQQMAYSRQKETYRSKQQNSNQRSFNHDVYSSNSPAGPQLLP